MTITRVISFIAILFLISGLVMVRAFEEALFQDPLHDYFLGNFQLYKVPQLSYIEQFARTSFRFLINTVLSLWILWFLYKKESFLNAALYVYLFAFIILTPIFLALLSVEGELAKMALFYTRRFLIHPILLFVLVAGFYFLKNKPSVRL
ncbi:MAG: exosortase F system-associated protein [Nonlabens sp.]